MERYVKNLVERQRENARLQAEAEHEKAKEEAFKVISEMHDDAPIGPEGPLRWVPQESPEKMVFAYDELSDWGKLGPQEGPSTGGGITCHRPDPRLTDLPLEPSNSESFRYTREVKFTPEDNYKTPKWKADPQFPDLSSKDTNPKDAVGTKKWRQFCTVPMTIIWELGVAMLEGARKYGRHNYRVAGVRSSVYVDAAMGHITQWWEGEDLDPDTRLSHLTKAMASLAVLRDAMIRGKMVDDRPPKTDLDAVRANLQGIVDEMFERIPEAREAYLEGDQDK